MDDPLTIDHLSRYNHCINLPNDILNPLRDENEKEEEEEVGGRVADELQERLPHYLPIIIIIISRQWSDEHDERYICLRIGEALTDPTGYLFTHHHHHHHHQHLHYHHL